MLRLGLILLLIFPAPVLAGAWPREQGQLFVAISGGLSADITTLEKKHDSSLYAEYGLPRNLTLGFSRYRDKDAEGHHFAFLRLPLHKTERGAHLSAEFGLGQKVTDEGQEPMAVAGLSWGRGLTIRDQSGWLAVDAAFHVPESVDPVFKLDTTLGLAISERAKLMGQVFLETDGEGYSASLTPSYVRRIKPLGADLVIGLNWHHDSGDTVGLRLGLWREF